MVTTFIINYNGIEDTIKCAKSLLNQTVNYNHTYILDNNSEEEEGKKLLELYKNETGVTVILSEKNLGFGMGINLMFEKAIQNCNPDYFLLLNNDAVADKNWIHELISFSKKNHSDLLSSKMIQVRRPHLIDNVGHFMLNTGEIIPIGTNEPIENYEKPFETIGASGGACLISRKLYDNIGGFDPYFFVGYEDAEYGLRAFLTGHKIMYCPTAIVHHKMSASIRKIFNYNYTLKIQLDIFYSYFKLLPIGILLFNMPFFILKYFLVFTIDVLFLRLKFLRILFHSSGLFLFKELWASLKARKEFYSNNSIKPSKRQIQKKMTFFFLFDVRRFWKYVVLGNTTQFEKY